MKNSRPLIIVGLVLVLFAGFIWLITIKPEKTRAKEDLRLARSYEQVKDIWNAHPKIQNKNDWQQEVEKKISSFNPSKEQLLDIENWYPVRRHLNITVVPDLSNRLTNIPDQPKFDTAIINHIWKAFQQTIPTRYHYGETMQDRFAVDISDREAAQGKFKNLANALIFDLSTLGAVSPIVHLRKEQSTFESNVQELYKLGATHIRGADYRDFFNSRATTNTKKSTIFDRYRNIAILITDGYLEVTGGPTYTDSKPIPVDPLTKLTGLEVLMLEIHERNPGDYQKNRQLWYKWLSAMGANVDYDHFFQQHNDASDKTKNLIDEFLQVKSKTIEMPLAKTEPNDQPVEKPEGTVTQSSDNAALIAKYIAMGDAKCSAFKKANTPQLYHIANEYYNYAAELAHSTPKVCE